MNGQSVGSTRTPPRTRQTPILDQLTPAARESFLQCTQERDLPKNTIVFYQGQPHIETYLVKTGLMRTYHLAANGREVTLAYWSDGDIVGGPDFFNTCPHIWCAKTMQPTTVFAIAGSDLLSLSYEVPEVAHALIEALTFKTHWLSLLVQMHNTQSVSERVTFLLVKLDEMYGVDHPDGRMLRYRFTQEDLATMVGTSRQWMCHTLHQLESEGLLSVRDRHIVIHHPENLAHAQIPHA